MTSIRPTQRSLRSTYLDFDLDFPLEVDFVERWGHYGRSFVDSGDLVGVIGKNTMIAVVHALEERFGTGVAHRQARPEPPSQGLGLGCQRGRPGCFVDCLEAVVEEQQVELEVGQWRRKVEGRRVGLGVGRFVVELRRLGEELRK